MDIDAAPTRRNGMNTARAPGGKLDWETHIEQSRVHIELRMYKAAAGMRILPQNSIWPSAPRPRVIAGPPEVIVGHPDGLAGSNRRQRWQFKRRILFGIGKSILGLDRVAKLKKRIRQRDLISPQERAEQRGRMRL